MLFRVKDEVKTARVAAIDLGSNTCRLVIAEVSPTKEVRNLEVFSRVVRLGENLSRSGYLAPSATERAVAVLGFCARKMRAYAPISLVRCVATEACRRALNGEAFKKNIEAKVGLSIDIITPQEEAELCLKGCMSLLNPSKPYALVFDIGGGSSEVLWVEVTSSGPKILEIISLPFGVVGLSELYGNYISVIFEDIRASIEKELKTLKAFDQIQNLVQRGEVQMIGCSGTATTIAALKLSLEAYDRALIDGTVMERQDIEEIRQTLWQMSPLERLSHPCIGWGRNDLVIPGLAIFAGIYDTFPVAQMCVADRGVRDGIILTLAEEVHKMLWDSQQT